MPFLVNDINPAVPAELAQLIDRLLRADPTARPESACRVVQELAALEAMLAGPAVGDTVQQLATVPQRTQPRSRPQPRRWRPLVAGAAVLAMMGALVWWMVERSLHHPASPPPPDSIAMPEPVDWPPFPAGPPDDQWCRQLANQPPERQFNLAAQKLADLNPGFDYRNAGGWVEPELVIRFEAKSNAIHDLRPLRALADLKHVGIHGLPPDGGALTDLSPLAGLRLKSVFVPNQPRLTDLSPLKGSRLVLLDVEGTGVDSLDDLSVELLQELQISHSRVRDLTPVRRMPNLKELRCRGCPIDSLEPLAGTPIRLLWADIRSDRDAAVLRQMPRLERINDMPIKDFWQKSSSAP